MDEKTKLKKVMDLIDKLAEPDDSDDIARLELEIREITGKVIYLRMNAKNIGDGQVWKN